MGILYIVSTPIGNLQDITFRAIKVLKSVNVILCEDTRVSGMLYKNVCQTNNENTLEKRPRFISYYEENEQLRIPFVIQLLKDGNNIALISDSGTPLISDPGFKLIREAIVVGIKVESIPGPSSVITSLVLSGLPTDKFLFLGFLPKKKGHRQKALEDVKKALEFVKTTVIFFESPYRLAETLNGLAVVFGDINIVIARELTKIHEEVKRGKISSLIELYRKRKPKGEIVVLFNLKE